MARRGVHSAFDYLLKGRTVKLMADQQKGFDPRIIVDQLLKRQSISIVESKEDQSTMELKIQKYTIPYRWSLKNLTVIFQLSRKDIAQLGAQTKKNVKDIAQMEENIWFDKYLKSISTMMIQFIAVEYAYKAVKIFHMVKKDPKAIIDKILLKEPPPSNGRDQSLNQIKAQLDMIMKAAQDGENGGSNNGRSSNGSSGSNSD